MLSRSFRFVGFFFATSAVAGVISIACSNGSSCPTPGGPAPGSPDTHCVDPDAGTPIANPTSQSSCHPDAGAGADAGPVDYGPAQYGVEGDDDDCKYHVTWSATAICENQGVVFTLKATNTVDGTAVTGANVEAELFLSPTHPAPTPFVTSTEGPPGTYTTQAAKFDAPGQWTVRFHFFEECSDLLDDSPHGHVSFLVDVP